MSKEQLTTPDGRSVDFHLTQIKSVASYLSFPQRASLKGMLDAAESPFRGGDADNLASLDILAEVDELVVVLKVLRSGLMGLGEEGGLTKADHESLKNINNTVQSLCRNAKLVAGASRLSKLQQGLLTYADTLSPDQKPTFIQSVKTHISIDLSSTL